MTTALRAAWINEPDRRKERKSVFPSGLNSLKNIEKIKRLDIQPFFYAVVAGMTDMELVLAGINFCTDKERYDYVTGLIRGVEQALFDAGYSRKGHPYWADVAEPTDGQIEKIIGAVESCLPVLQERGQALQKSAGHGSKEHIIFIEFVDRFAGFNKAITNFEDHLSYRQRRRDRLTVDQGIQMCALA